MATPPRRRLVTRDVRILGAVCSLRAVVRLDLLDFDGARDDLGRFLALGVESAHGHSLLGDVLWVEGRPAEAIEEYRRALAIDDRFGARLGLGLALLDRGDRGSALEVFAQIERDPVATDAQKHAAIACQAWAWIHPRCAEASYVDGARHVNRLLGAQAEFPIEFLVEGAFQTVRGEHQSAVAMFGKHRGLWVLLPEVGFFYARALRALGRVADSDEVRDRAVRLRPDLAGAFPRDR